MKLTAAARLMQAQRKNRRGGAPSVLRPCPYCGVEFGARKLRAHLPRCDKRGKE